MRTWNKGWERTVWAQPLGIEDGVDLDDFENDRASLIPSLELQVSERVVDLVQEGFDLAIHNGVPADSSVVARKIATTRIVPVATPVAVPRVARVVVREK